jgi:hypothetical protein
MNRVRVPVEATIVKQPSSRQLLWGILLLGLSVSGLSNSDPGWASFSMAPSGWDWTRLVDLLLLGLAAGLIAAWADRTARWVRSK